MSNTVQKIEQLDCRIPEGFLEQELKNAVAASLSVMSEREIVNSVMAELSRQKKSKMEAIINGSYNAKLITRKRLNQYMQDSDFASWLAEQETGK